MAIFAITIRGPEFGIVLCIILGRAVKDIGLKINRKKTVYLRFNVEGNLDGNSYINLQGQNWERVNTFKYLGATLAEI